MPGPDDYAARRDVFRPVYPDGVPPRPWALRAAPACLCSTDYEILTPAVPPEHPFEFIAGHLTNKPAMAAFLIQAVNAYDGLVAERDELRRQLAEAQALIKRYL
jgi:hypothetical protein